MLNDELTASAIQISHAPELPMSTAVLQTKFCINTMFFSDADISFSSLSISLGWIIKSWKSRTQTKITKQWLYTDFYQVIRIKYIKFN